MKSPSTQRTDFGLMAMKTDGYAEGHARQNKSQHVADRLWLDGYDDGRLCRGSY